ncbi:MAG: right-handed parallel beta-helix repeat-containing protein [Protaetiibacter sp.]
MPTPRRTPSRVLGSLGVVALLTALLGCASPAPEDTLAPQTVRVPEDAATITEAVELVAEGGLVLVGAGSYREQVLVTTPGVTVRGLDRNEVVIDAEGIRPYGIVAIADGVSIENLTVTGALYYGALVTGLHDENGPIAHGGDGYSPFDPASFPPVQRFAIDHVTAYNNGLYGLYAFNAQHGVIRDSYASGSADSGIYVGQCEDCDILVTGNVAENNAVGFENANASDSVRVVGNRFSGNRVGMTFLSNHQEAFAPQRGNTVVGNLVASNTAADSPAQADGGFGIGIGIGAGTGNTFERNLISGNPRAGVLLTSTEDLAALGNTFRGNAFTGNGVDVANTSTARAPAQGNCVEDEVTSVVPDGLLDQCAPDVDQPSADASALPAIEAPPGVSFLRVTPPPAQPQLPDVDAPARVLPATVPDPDLTAVALPGADFLADRARG